MKPNFNNCIAIGVVDKHATAKQFVECFSATIVAEKNDWIEVQAGLYRFFFVEDGTRDIAFSVDVQDERAATAALVGAGFQVDEPISSLTKETFVRNVDGILINVFPVN